MVPNHGDADQPLARGGAQGRWRAGGAGRARSRRLDRARSLGTARFRCRSRPAGTNRDGRRKAASSGGRIPTASRPGRSRCEGEGSRFEAAPLFIEQLDSVRTLAFGAEGMLALRRQELDLIGKAEKLIAENANLSARLTAAVDQ